MHLKLIFISTIKTCGLYVINRGFVGACLSAVSVDCKCHCVTLSLRSNAADYRLELEGFSLKQSNQTDSPHLLLDVHANKL